MKALFATLFGSWAAFTGIPQLKISEPECENIARPFARMLRRYPPVANIARKVTDPLAFFGAAAAAFLPRMVIWRMASLGAVPTGPSSIAVPRAPSTVDANSSEVAAMAAEAAARQNGGVSTEAFERIVDRVREPFSD